MKDIHMTDTPEFGLIVEVAASEWANTNRRLAFLEAVLVQVLRDENPVREWFTAKELAALNLPELQYSPAGITRKSIHHKWAYKTVKQHGRKMLAYHYSSLPNRAFEAFIRRIVDLPDGVNTIPDYIPVRPAESTPTAQWVLPLMRIIKTEHSSSWRHAYIILSETLPETVCMPQKNEVKAFFERVSG